MGLPGRDTIGTLQPPLVRRSACNDVRTAFGSIATTEFTQTIETDQEPIAFRSREGGGGAGEIDGAERRERICNGVGDGGEGGDGAGFVAAL